MFCHEGPWHKVDRIWTIHSDGSGLKLIHQRTMIMEIAGLSGVNQAYAVELKRANEK